jgi:hypothetical protein
MKKLLLVTAAMCALPAIASADEVLKWRHVQHAKTFQTVEVGDVSGHVLANYRVIGLAMFPDGSLGTTTVIGASDVVNGSGTLNGYYSLETPDGSELWLKFTGVITVEGKASPRKGTAIVIGGKGRFAGAKGEGTWKGDGTNIGPDLISYIDNVITLKTAVVGK